VSIGKMYTTEEIAKDKQDSSSKQAY
jgi:hypothetical protein